MLIMMGISFYTSRLVLEALGIEDFGVYNIVGGIVLLFSFLNNAMANATQRFISFELGSEHGIGLKKIFCMSVNCHILIAIILFLLSETIGLWFVNSYLNIPEDRMVAANIVYQFSIFSFVANIVRVPYYAVIISHERMVFFAYISILEAILKLGIVYIILYSSFDRLIQYGALNFIIYISTLILYIIYTRKQFKECRFSKYWNKNIFRSLMSFSGWSMVNGSSSIVAQQGGNILLNIFFNVGINAGYGVAIQVSNAIYQFVSNFQVSFQPQIVKLYAHNDIEEESILLTRASKFSFFLVFIIFLPIAMSMDECLSIWLKDVPPYASQLTLWMIIFFLIDAIQGPLWMAIYGTGKIKSYTIWTSILTFLNLPISFILLVQGFSPICVVIIRVVLNVCCSIYRCILINRLIGYPIKSYLEMVLFQVTPVIAICLPLAYLIRKSFTSSLLNLFIVSGIILILSPIVVYFVGLCKEERKKLYKLFKSKIRNC